MAKSQMNNQKAASLSVSATLNRGPVSRASAPAGLSQSEKVSGWVTDRAWVSGLTGALAVVICAAWYNSTNALFNGVRIGSYQLTDDRTDSILAALFMVTGTMIVVEIIRLWLRAGRDFIQLAPELKRGRYMTFLADALISYLKYLCVFWLVIQFFWWANEYGYQRGAAYYRGWFRFMEIAWVGYLWLGLPYIALTRAFKHDTEADRQDFSELFSRTVVYLTSWIPGCKSWRRDFSESDKKATRALLVKLFFAPLMTVFFVDQFPHLVNNVGYVFGGIPAVLADGNYTHSRFNTDFFNISIAVIFSIDVALAWCGYIISSRWVDNHTRSVEPTLLGWVVCICCYPPFQMFLGLYFSAPGEREVLNFTEQWLVTIFTGFMVLSYFVYMSATLWFGVRFSNLTNRGIIRTGPFAYIRHPAYASKNFAWWCVMFPAVIYNASHTGLHLAFLQILGLVLMTWFYYMRAMTEERHLSADPQYVDYCKQVKHRFIPGLM
jgi:protein-S-isoprenylcysteine O-methyltransferase Ste14